ncbi:hypothetical protein BKA70DRAFT_1260171 [Coprinopsis sp. MPI-PUGE-AT-0042]|nr:hypothetical protein BKA70DRAFT_1260171 [Coprinopsis sp. MPI-PUGE-AT-0042]
MPTPALFPEIWNNILHFVPLFEQGKLLQVSRLFHDIAVPLVFSAIKIYFIGGDGAYAFLSTTHDEFKEEITSKLMIQSYQLLRRITTDPSFAWIVKSVTVISSSDSESVFESLLLSDALALLPNLQTFRWFGTDPNPIEEVLQNLQGSISSLTLKTCVPSNDFFPRFRGIQHLALPTPFYYPDDEESHDDVTASSTLLDITADIDFEGIMASLSVHDMQSLTLNGRHLAALSIKVLDTLKQLDICITTILMTPGFDLVLRHSVALEGLTIYGYCDQSVFSWLDCNASDVPCLRSFRLSCDRFGMIQPPSTHELAILTTFLQDRPKLRRLYLRIPSLDLASLQSLSPPIQAMKSLEVLGLHTGTVNIDDWFIPFFLDLLPPTLKGLHLAVDWNGSSLLPLIDHLPRLPRLSFFHMYGISTRLPLKLDDIAVTAVNVKLVGLNRALWDVMARSPELELRKWPRWKIKFCVEEDFEDSDHYWLFQYN